MSSSPSGEPAGSDGVLIEDFALYFDVGWPRGAVRGLGLVLRTTPRRCKSLPPVDGSHLYISEEEPIQLAERHLTCSPSRQ